MNDAFIVHCCTHKVLYSHVCVCGGVSPHDHLLVVKMGIFFLDAVVKMCGLLDAKTSGCQH